MGSGTGYESGTEVGLCFRVESGTEVGLCVSG